MKNELIQLIEKFLRKQTNDEEVIRLKELFSKTEKAVFRGSFFQLCLYSEKSINLLLFNGDNENSSPNVGFISEFLLFLSTEKSSFFVFLFLFKSSIIFTDLQHIFQLWSLYQIFDYYNK